MPPSLTLDVIATALVGLVIFFHIIGKAITGYFEARKSIRSAAADPVLTGVGLELGNREQVDRLIAAVNRVADVLEDKKQSEMADKLDQLLERMKEHPAPPRRR